MPEKKKIGANLRDYGMADTDIKLFVYWVAEQKGVDSSDRKVGDALLDKKNCEAWIKDWNEAKMLEETA